MKKVLFFLASALLLAACENYYIDKNLGGSDYNPTDVRTVDYTLTDADYKAIASNKENIALALNECLKDSATNAIVDSAAYKAFLRIGTNLAFNNEAPADLYVPAFLTSKFPQFSKGSLFNITYNNCEGAPAYLKDFAHTTKYTLTPADYETIWEGKTGIHYLTPATLPKLTSVLPEEAETGDFLAVVYDFKSKEPVFGDEEEEEEFVPGGDPNFFTGTPESRGFYTPTEVIQAYKDGIIGEGDSIKVGGIICKWYKKSSRFDEFLNVSYYINDNNDSIFEMYNSYSLNRDSFPTYEYVDEYNATCVDAAGREFSLGDTVIGTGALTYYANYNVYEFKSGCYLLEYRPLAKKPTKVAPKQEADAQEGKMTMLYQCDGVKWVQYTNTSATVEVLPEEVYSAVGYTYLLDKNKDVLTTYLKQTYPYAQAGKAYTLVYVSTKEGAYNAIEFVYNGTEFVENLGLSTATTTFSLTDVWGSTIYYKQAIMGEGQGKLTIQNVICNEPLTYVWYYSAAYGMCASAFKNGASYESEAWLLTPQIDLSRAKTPVFSFDHAFNKAEGDFTNECAVLVSTDYAGDVTTATWTQIDWNTLTDGTLDVPAGNSWTFQPTGQLDFTEFAGKKIYIGFRYTTEGGKSGTWELKNLLLTEPEQ